MSEEANDPSSPRVPEEQEASLSRDDLALEVIAMMEELGDDFSGDPQVSDPGQAGMEEDAAPGAAPIQRPLKSNALKRLGEKVRQLQQEGKSVGEGPLTEEGSEEDEGNDSEMDSAPRRSAGADFLNPLVADDAIDEDIEAAEDLDLKVEGHGLEKDTVAANLATAEEPSPPGGRVMTSGPAVPSPEKFRAAADVETTKISVDSRQAGALGKEDQASGENAGGEKAGKPTSSEKLSATDLPVTAEPVIPGKAVPPNKRKSQPEKEMRSAEAQDRTEADGLSEPPEGGGAKESNAVRAALSPVGLALAKHEEPDSKHKDSRHSSETGEGASDPAMAGGKKSLSASETDAVKGPSEELRGSERAWSGYAGREGEAQPVPKRGELGEAANLIRRLKERSKVGGDVEGGLTESGRERGRSGRKEESVGRQADHAPMGSLTSQSEDSQQNKTGGLGLSDQKEEKEKSSPDSPVVVAGSSEEDLITYFMLPSDEKEHEQKHSEEIPRSHEERFESLSRAQDSLPQGRPSGYSNRQVSNSQKVSLATPEAGQGNERGGKRQVKEQPTREGNVSIPLGSLSGSSDGLAKSEEKKSSHARFLFLVLFAMVAVGGGGGAYLLYQRGGMQGIVEILDRGAVNRSEIPDGLNGKRKDTPSPMDVSSATVKEPSVEKTDETVSLSEKINLQDNQVLKAIRLRESEGVVIPAASGFSIPLENRTEEILSGLRNKVVNLDGEEARKPGRREVPVAAREGPRAVLDAFLAAETPSERLRYTLGAPKIKNELKAYYRGRNSIAVDVRTVKETYRGVTSSGNQEAILYQVTSAGNPRGYQVAVEESEDGYKVDWKFFVHCEDKILEKFIARKSEGKVDEFMVVASRSQSFDSEFSEEAGYLCLEIRPPHFEPFYQAFVRVGSDQAAVLNDEMRWGEKYFVVLDLEWIKSEGSDSLYLGVRDFTRMTWRDE